jgi:2OG-Fe(II) oxygenase superfamily
VTLSQLERWEHELPVLRAAYANADPFPHLVLDDVLDRATYARAAQEFPPLADGSWTNYVHVNELKYANTKPVTWGPTLRALLRTLTTPRFVHFLEGLTGIGGLLADRAMDGGGLHQVPAGGFLNVHADFTAHHAVANWQRRVNVLLYFNDLWHPDWGGELELWARDMSRPVTRIAPVANRMMVFTTDEKSFHGHPDPLRCPSGEARKSLALYYFTTESQPMVRSTNYQPRPGEGIKRVGIYLDKGVLRAYDAVKRRLRLSDAAASRLLGRGRSATGRVRRPP